MSVAQLNKRLLFFAILLALFALALVLQYASVMLASLPGNQGKLQQELERGTILDRNGRILALETTVYTLSAWPGNLEDPFRTAHLLSPLLGEDENALYKKLSSSTKALILKSRLDRKTADNLKLLIDMENLGGLLLEPESNRTYPEKGSAAQIIGFTGKDNQGLEGLEYRFNQELGSPETFMPDGRAYGRQLVLTLDSVIQQSMEKLAEKAWKDYQAQGVMLYVMDSRTGELLAYVNCPSYDPNNWQASTPEERRNMGTGFTYEPGSVFKVFTMSSIMNRGRINGQTLFMTSAGYRNKLFRDPITDLSDYGTISTEGIIVHSSNVGAALASDTVSNQEFHQDLQDFGFGNPTGIEIPGEEKGILKNPGQWNPRTKPTLAFGQEISVTALQMLQAATAIANDGVMLRPRIVRQILSTQGQVLQDFSPQTVRNLLKPEVARAMRHYMNSATLEDGTGHRSRVEGLDLSVKTGTAQMIDPEKGTYSARDYIASSLGILPTDKPRLIIYAVIIKPRGEIYGGRIAAPMIKSAAEFLIPYLGLEREGDQVIVQSPQIQIHIPQLPTLGKTVPSYIGLPLRTVMELHRNPDIQAVIEGSGFVTRQDPPAGTAYKAGMTIHLILGKEDPSSAGGTDTSGTSKSGSGTGDMPADSSQPGEAAGQ